MSTSTHQPASSFVNRKLTLTNFLELKGCSFCSWLIASARLIASQVPQSNISSCNGSWIEWQHQFRSSHFFTKVLQQFLYLIPEVLINIQSLSFVLESQMFAHLYFGRVLRYRIFLPSRLTTWKWYLFHLSKSIWRLTY